MLERNNLGRNVTSFNHKIDHIVFLKIKDDEKCGLQLVFCCNEKFENYTATNSKRIAVPTLAVFLWNYA